MLLTQSWRMNSWNHPCIIYSCLFSTGSVATVSPHEHPLSLFPELLQAPPLPLELTLVSHPVLLSCHWVTEVNGSVAPFSNLTLALWVLVSLPSHQLWWSCRVFLLHWLLSLDTALNLWPHKTPEGESCALCDYSFLDQLSSSYIVKHFESAWC